MNENVNKLPLNKLNSFEILKLTEGTQAVKLGTSLTANRQYN